MDIKTALFISGAKNSSIFKKIPNLTIWWKNDCSILITNRGNAAKTFLSNASEENHEELKKCYKEAKIKLKKNLKKTALKHSAMN